MSTKDKKRLGKNSVTGKSCHWVIIRWGMQITELFFHQKNWENWENLGNCVFF